MNNLSSYCGLIDAKIRGSDKDLPVRTCISLMRILHEHLRLAPVDLDLADFPRSQKNLGPGVLSI